MLNIAHAHASVVLVIFHYCMLQNKLSARQVTSVVVFFAYLIKSNLDKEGSYINSTKEVV